MVGRPWKQRGREVVFSLGKQIASARNYENSGKRGPPGAIVRSLDFVLFMMGSH